MRCGLSSAPTCAHFGEESRYKAAELTNCPTVTRDWLLGLLSGLIGAAFGVVLYAVWDLWKERRASSGRIRALQEIVGADLSTNLIRIKRHAQALNDELTWLKDRKALVGPLPLLRTAFWDMLRTEPTSKFFTVEEKDKLHEIFDSTEEVNERLRAREEFKNNNGAMTNFPSTMTIHDEDLIKVLGSLEKQLESLDKSLPARESAA